MEPRSPAISGIEAAGERLRGRLRRTPFSRADGLSELTGVDLYCKREHLQVTGSFKERGACNKLLTLPGSTHGVIAASAGNHALGLSFHGQRLNVPVTVVMPKFAPLIKVSQCRALGAEVVLFGSRFEECKDHARALADERGLTFVHGFDDPTVIEGQGTAALEMLEDAEEAALPPLDAVLVPVGGGGLLAGTALIVRHLSPSTRIIAVEASHAPTLTRALEAGHPVMVDTEASLADGLHVAQLGSIPFEVLQDHVDDVILVEEEQIATAIVRLMELEKTIVEGSGAVGLAALMGPAQGKFAGQHVGLFLTGGNIDLTTISRIIERGLAAEGRLCRVSVDLRDHPGSLASLSQLVAKTGANVQQIDHDRNFGPPDISRVRVDLVLQTRDHEHIAEVEQALTAAGLHWTR